MPPAISGFAEPLPADGPIASPPDGQSAGKADYCQCFANGGRLPPMPPRFPDSPNPPCGRPPVAVLPHPTAGQSAGKADYCQCFAKEAGFRRCPPRFWDSPNPCLRTANTVGQSVGEAN